jgi:hypothetical protein
MKLKMICAVSLMSIACTRMAGAPSIAQKSNVRTGIMQNASGDSPNLCQITQDICPNHPEYVGTFEDTWGEENAGALDDPNACMQRATDNYYWCGGPNLMSGHSTTASYYSGGNLIQTKVVGNDIQPPIGDGSFLPRDDFGQKLEPIGDHLLIAVGQYPNSYENFEAAGVGAPSAVMRYVFMHQSPDNLIATAYKTLDYLNGLSNSDMILLQIGYEMLDHDAPVDPAVARGEYDAKIYAFCTYLQIVNRPAFIRIGYEFNGTWNNYTPGSYKQAFQRITNILRGCPLNYPIATGWNFYPDPYYPNITDYWQYYPGDEYVDWWAINLFFPPGPEAQQFVTDARLRGKPVYVGEATPQHVGAQTDEAWDQWFQPYFDFIHKNPNIKMIDYINDDWAKSRAGDGSLPWENWGNAIIQPGSLIQRNFSRELSKPQYILRQPGNGVLSRINLNW